MTGSIMDWTIDPSTNDVADAAINWQEFQDPATVNNSSRQMMGRVAEYLADSSPRRTSGGASNAFTVTVASSPASLKDGMVVYFYANRSNSGAATLAVNSFPAYPMRAKTGIELANGELQNGTVVGAYFRIASNEWIVINSGFHVNALAPALYQSNFANLPVGSPIAWPTELVPSGWLRMDGSAVSRTGYPLLFTAYGTRYGVGDGSTTFNLPDWRGKFVRGYDGGAANDPDRASRTNRGDGTTGDVVGTNQADATKAHTHASGTLAADSAGAHTHTTLASANTGGSAPSGGGGTYGSLPLNITSSSNGAHTHTISGASASTGGNETRPINVTAVWICLAVPALAALTVTGTNGVQYRFDTGTTDADPGAGYLRFNNATLASATTMYISETDNAGANLAPYLATWGLGSQGTLIINKVGAQGTNAIFNVSGASTDAGVYDRVTVALVVSNGTFAAGDPISVQFSTGGAGSGYTATSTSGLTIATGALSLVTQGGLAYTAGARVRIANDSTHYMEGVVTSYSGTAMGVSVDRAVGTGTFSAWTINIAGDVGAAGAPGAGSVSSVNGQTGVVVLAKSDVGLANADNTSDVNKPTSTAQAASIAAAVLPLVTGAGTVVNGQLSVFSGTTGKLLAASGLSGILRAAAGVPSVAILNQHYLAPIAISDLTGATDVTADITAAISALPAAPIGGTIYLPPGVLLVNSTITLDRPVNFVGAGRDSTTIVCGSDTGHLFDAASGAATKSRFHNFTVTTRNAVVTISNASPAVVGWTAHGLSAGQAVQISTYGTIPTGIVNGSYYYVLATGLTANSFQISLTAGGAAINTSSAGTGPFNCYMAKTAGSHFRLNTIRCVIDNVYSDHAYRSITGTDASTLTVIMNSEVRNLTPHAIASGSAGYYGGNGANTPTALLLDGFNVGCDYTQSLPYAGVHLTSGDAPMIVNGEINSCTVGLLLEAANTKSITTPYLYNTFFDSHSTASLYVTTVGNGNVTRVNAVGCWFTGSSVGDGVTLQYGAGATGIIEGVELVACKVSKNAGNGINIANAVWKNVSVTACVIAQNTLSGIAAVANTNNIVLQNNRIGAFDNFTGNGTGITIAAGTSANITAQCNTLAGNTTATAIGTLSGVNNRFEFNAGYNALYPTNLFPATNAIEVRNGVNPQAFYLYGTYTDASNYERLQIKYDNALTRYEISMAAAGTGVARTVFFVAGATGAYVLANPAGDLQFGQGGIGNYLTVSTSGNVLAWGSILSKAPTSGIGYGAGAGGAVTQATSKATGVTLSKACADITLNAASLAASTVVSFVVTATGALATDNYILNHISGGTIGAYSLNAVGAAGSYTVYVRNLTAGALAEAIVIRVTTLRSANT